MVESADDPSLLDRIRSSARKVKAHVSRNPLAAGDQRTALPLNNLPTPNDAHTTVNGAVEKSSSGNNALPSRALSGARVPDATSAKLPPPAPPPAEGGHGEASSTLNPEEKPNVAIRFYVVVRETLLSSWINVLLVFVPVGIAVQAAGINPTIVFAINAIAIIPLAGLLSYATESVASEMGDTIGALMNVTFGNAVELIIFNSIASLVICFFLVLIFCVTFHMLTRVAFYDSIALVKNEIPIVKASLLGSILANLLLILGMCFLFGGLRFREQIYNSVVTQMSACLLSLSVLSLLLPTAFHASFTDSAKADRAVLQVSRGTSIILLLVYVLYLLFQLKSHAYLYRSTPQHVIDEESYPGVLAEMLDSSSSSDTSSSSSSTDSDSSGSRTTAKRIKRVLRRKRRKSSTSSKDTPSLPSSVGTPSASNFSHIGHDMTIPEARGEHQVLVRQPLGAILSGDEADTDGENEKHLSRTRGATITSRDFETEQSSSRHETAKTRKAKKSSKNKHRKAGSSREKLPQLSEKPEKPDTRKESVGDRSEKPRVDFAEEAPSTLDSFARKPPFMLRGIAVARPPMPTMPRMLSTTVFSAANPTGPSYSGSQVPGITPQALHRSNSLPSRLNQTQSMPVATAIPAMPIMNVHPSLPPEDSVTAKKHMSRTAAMIMLLVSTALVAVCAEFLVGSIGYLVGNTGVSEAFIGLIILPIVGNAAEHVTAVTVASKNKMDLAIGVAVGSSIQIALFVTPVIVLLGWILQKDTMSLYFSLFETVSLFVTVFVVNFLVLDGRSNYLEGALLIAVYVIIAVAAFFYPDSDEQSQIGGAEAPRRLLKFV